MEDAHPPRVGRVPRDGDEVDGDVDRRRWRAARSARKIDAPLSTPTSTTPSGWSALISAASACRRTRDGRLVEQRLRRRDPFPSASRLAPSGATGGVTRRASRAPLRAGARCAAGVRARRARTSSSWSRARASGLRWRTYGSSTWPNSTASRSANVRYMRRCRASTPRAKKPAADARDLERVVVVAGLAADLQRRAEQPEALELARPARLRGPPPPASSPRE